MVEAAPNDTLQTASEPVRKLVFRAAAASLSLALFLCMLKLAATVMTGSVAILSSLVDSLADLLASAITLVAVWISQRPPDRLHRYGHGKAEALSALAQGALVAGSAVLVLAQAFARFIDPQPVESGHVGVAVILLSIGLSLALVAFQRHVIRRSGSQAIAADSLHYQSDLLINLAVLGSLLLSSSFGLPMADPLFGTLIALYLLVASTRILNTSVQSLMDRELPQTERDAIGAIIEAQPEVQGFHDLRTRAASGTQFIEFHIELDGEMSVLEAHAVTDELEARLGEAFPAAEVIIHQEPAGLIDDRLDHRIRQAERRRKAARGLI